VGRAGVYSGRNMVEMEERGGLVRSEIVCVWGGVVSKGVL